MVKLRCEAPIFINSATSLQNFSPWLENFKQKYEILIEEERLKSSKKIIDLGCGNNPVQGACAAVDFYVDPKERKMGAGENIDVGKMKEKGIRFANARIDSHLP